MDKRIRSFEAQFRAAPELGEGMAEAIVTVYDSEYKIGRKTYEAIDRRAFERDADGKRTFPIFYEHGWDAGPIGHQTFESNERGIKATQTYYIEDDPRARTVFRALKAKALKEHSIGFLVTDDGIEVTERSNGETLERITRGELLESSVVVRGANRETETVTTRAIPPAVAPAPAVPAAPGAVDPAAVEVEEEKPTKATLLAEVARVVEMAADLGMAEQLPQIVKNYLKIFDEPAPAAPAPPDPAAVAAPAARSVDLTPELVRALARGRDGS